MLLNQRATQIQPQPRSTDPSGLYIVSAHEASKPEDIQITAEGDTLTIRVAKKGEEKVEKPTYVRRERYEGEMTRFFTLPGRFDAEKITATYEHGVLFLTVPKAEVVKPKQIPVKIKEAVGVR